LTLALDNLPLHFGTPRLGQADTRQFCDVAESFPKIALIHNPDKLIHVASGMAAMAMPQPLCKGNRRLRRTPAKSTIGAVPVAGAPPEMTKHLRHGHHERDVAGIWQH
jgi:hypothetical protein